MEKAKFVSRYVGSMGGIATLQGIVAYVLLVRPETLLEISKFTIRLLPFLEDIPKASLSPWVTVAGAFLALQAMGFLCAAVFPKRWPYRLLCFCSSAVAMAALVFLYSRPLRFPPIFFGALWEGALALWVAWLLLLEIFQRPFAPLPANGGATPASSPAR